MPGPGTQPHDTPAANVACVLAGPDGQHVTAWTATNIMLNGGRSAFADHATNGYIYLAGGTSRLPHFFWFGTGTAIPQAGDTALQFYVTGKVTSVASAVGASGLTARLYCQLGPIELTGLITEMMLARMPSAVAGPANYVFAKALIDGGTGWTHRSGSGAIFYWDFVLGTGQQPF